jgi:GNAT superfamily N-acetyltransferase
VTIAYEWRGAFDDQEVNALHAEGFQHAGSSSGWWQRVRRHSLGWVCARDGTDLVGFVNVAWDGGAHAFILDTVVGARVRRQGVGTRLVVIATDEARTAGCQWLHVDFEGQLRGFYLQACGFRPTPAGLIALTEPETP